MMIVTGRVKVRPESIDAALAVSLEHVERSRQEPGCITHSVFRSVEDENALFFYEEWEDDAALKAHFAVPESLQFVTRLSEFAAEPPKMDVRDASAGEDVV
jgi:quinol monooxygenase YgiN